MAGATAHLLSPVERKIRRQLGSGREAGWMAHAPDILVTSAAQPLLRGLELARLRGIHAHPGHMALAAHLIR